MNYNKHFNLEGKHAFLGASQSTWLRKTDDDLFDTLVEEEQKCGCRVTTPMSLSELKLLFNTRKKYDFYCGDLYNGI